jgi:hypothetical protein
MTKLGITPGVHGEDVQEKKDDDLTTVKVDPKVFTILQPIGAAPPVYTQPAPVREKSSACKWLVLITFIASATILTIFLGNLLMADQPMAKIFVITTSDGEATEAPKAEAQKSVPVEVLPVKTVDGGSENTVNDQNKIVDGSVIQEQQPDQSQSNPWMAFAQARYAQQQQEANLWRWRRIQQVLYQQHMMREQWAQQQQWMAEQQRAQWLARAQWEAAREQAAHVEQGRAMQMRQQQWEQEQANQQQWQQYWQNQAQQGQQTQPQQWQQYYWNQNQEQQQPQQQQQEQPQFHPRLLLLRQLTRVLPIHMSVRLPEGQQTEQPTELPQPSIHDRIYQEMQKKAQGMEFNAPSRPIWTAITPTPEPATTKFDEEAAFQENLKKSLEAEAQSTTTMAPPPVTEEDDEKHSDAEDGVLKDIFSALASAQETTTVAPEPSTENVFKAFSTEQDSKIDADNKANEKNVFKAFETDEDKESSEVAAEKSGFAAFEQDGSPKVEEGEKVDEPKPREEVSGEALPVVVFEDRFPKLEERTTTPETPEASSESSSAEVSAETSDPVPSEPVPSDEPAPSETSLSEPSSAPVPSASSEPSKEEDESSSEEHDPLAAFLKYFEQEARRMAEIRAAASSEEPVDTPEGEASQNPSQNPTAAVDVPEANFKPASHAITV